MNLKFNTNHFVRVKLTDHGRECLVLNYKEQQEQFKKVFPGFNGHKYRPPQEDSDGWSKWQLWELMSALGGHMLIGMGAPLTFETEIEIILNEQ